MKKATDRSHSHYSEEVQALVKHFQDLYVGYTKTTDYNWKQDNNQRTAVVQSAWDCLARARKKETGSGFYTPPKDTSDDIC
jgi:hypothetical protein